MPIIGVVENMSGFVCPKCKVTLTHTPVQEKCIQALRAYAWLVLVSKEVEHTEKRNEAKRSEICARICSILAHYKKNQVVRRLCLLSCADILQIHWTGYSALIFTTTSKLTLHKIKSTKFCFSTFLCLVFFPFRFNFLRLLHSFKGGPYTVSFLFNIWNFIFGRGDDIKGPQYPVLLLNSEITTL